MNYWLFKSEPDEFSIDDLKKVKTEPWNGIRNYQARNTLRDKVKVGDEVFIYHSSCKNVGIAGIATVAKAAYPDPSQFDTKSKYYDAKADPAKPRWFCVDVKFKQRFNEVIPLAQLRDTPQLSDMVLLKHGRLSIQPVSKKEWNAIVKLA